MLAKPCAAASTMIGARRLRNSAAFTIIGARRLRNSAAFTMVGARRRKNSAALIVGMILPRKQRTECLPSRTRIIVWSRLEYILPRGLSPYGGLYCVVVCRISFEVLAKDGIDGPALELGVCLLSFELLAKDGINGLAFELGQLFFALAGYGLDGPAFCFDFASDFDFGI